MRQFPFGVIYNSTVFAFGNNIQRDTTCEPYGLYGGFPYIPFWSFLKRVYGFLTALLFPIIQGNTTVYMDNITVL